MLKVYLKGRPKESPLPPFSPYRFDARMEASAMKKTQMPVRGALGLPDWLEGREIAEFGSLNFARF